MKIFMSLALYKRFLLAIRQRFTVSPELSKRNYPLRIVLYNGKEGVVKEITIFMPKGTVRALVLAKQF